MLQVYVWASTIVLGYLALWWSTKGFPNLVMKAILFVLAVVGIVVLSKGLV